MLVVPSPKFQERLLMLPVELSVKLTVKGTLPVVILLLKLAFGAVVGAEMEFVTSLEKSLLLPALSNAFTAK